MDNREKAIIRHIEEADLRNILIGFKFNWFDIDSCVKQIKEKYDIKKKPATKDIE